MKKPIIKARIHYGAKSLDISIPANIVEEYEINEGDVFSVNVKQTSEGMELIYTRIFKQ